MKHIAVTENEVRTILAVLNELNKMPYDKINTFLGSLTIDKMQELRHKLNNWYQGEVLGNKYDEELGWYNPEKESEHCAYATTSDNDLLPLSQKENKMENDMTYEYWRENVMDERLVYLDSDEKYEM